MRIVILFLVLAAAIPCLAQEPLAEAKFHEGSDYYINGNREKALSSVKTGLMSDPGNQKLTELKKLLDEDKKKEEKKKEQKKKEKEEKQKEKQKEKKEKEKKKKEEKQKEEKQKEEKQDDKSKE